MADRNKTELTLRVTQAAANWLAGIGCKPIETEVPIEPGWVADCAALWCPTRTEATKHKLIPRRPAYSREGHAERYAAWDETYMALPCPMTVVLEVKTSRSDFAADDKWTRPSPADIRILAMPKGIVPSERWPEGWWILLHHDAGGLVATPKRGTLTPTTDGQRLQIAHSIGERRHNRTCYAMWRDLNKSHKDDENERINRARIELVFNAVLTYLESPDTSFEDAFTRRDWGSSTKMKPPYWLKDRIDALKARAQAADELHQITSGE